MRRTTDRAREKRREERDKPAPPVCTATYKVNHSDELLAFLLRKCNTSRNNVKSLLARRQVLVNGGVVTQFDYPLAKDDEIKIAKKPVEGNNAPKRAAKKQVKPKLRIIYEDEDVVAVDKPVGLLSVESDKETECAYAYVAQYLAAQGKRPYVLHRIDKETSGVLAFAKNPKVHSMLRMQWNDLVTLREYHAVAEGVFEKKSDTVVCYLKENANHMMYATSDPTGQKAITRYEVERENGQYSLLKVQIETGRKNQIRVQMQKLGHPIVGDEKYGHTKDPLKRLGLHATRLAFTHPVTKETITLYAPPPCVFRDLFGG